MKTSDQIVPGRMRGKNLPHSAALSSRCCRPQTQELKLTAYKARRKENQEEEATQQTFSYRCVNFSLVPSCCFWLLRVVHKRERRRAVWGVPSSSSYLLLPDITPSRRFLGRKGNKEMIHPLTHTHLVRTTNRELRPRRPSLPSLPHSLSLLSSLSPSLFLSHYSRLLNTTLALIPYHYYQQNARTHTHLH